VNAAGFELPRELTRSHRFLVDTLTSALQADRPDTLHAPKERHDPHPPSDEHHAATR